MTDGKRVRTGLCLLATLVLSPGCKGASGGGAGASGEADPKFDQAWSSLAAHGVEALYIEDDRGEGLMGNVRRAADLRPTDPDDSAGALTGEKDVGAQVLPQSPEGEDVQKVIRSNLAAVKSCYMSMARTGVRRSGKAIVTFSIPPSGKPTEVKVEAPTFQGTSLSKCVSGQVARWTFPASVKGGGAVSYPFVFVGG